MKDIPEKDRSILRQLAEAQAKVAALPVQRETAAAWKRLNALKPGRPLVWINELPWHEMDVDGELALQSTHPFCRNVESQLRQILYQWKHLPGDMVVENTFFSPLAVHDTGFGIGEDVNFIRQDPKSGIASRTFHPQIKDEKDLSKIKTPVLTHNKAASEETFQTLQSLFGDILPIKKQGIIHSWFAPWDELIRWYGVEEAMVDMIDRPELVQQAMDRLVKAYLARLDQWEALNVLSLSSGNNRVGSGGLGYTDELPAEGFNPARVRAKDQWGCATAQIFCDVSPAMHEEFALQYERRWLERFGLNYYGCCEPLHNKLDILASVPRLRKISMSPWADVDKAAPLLSGRYVFSCKPSPAVLATDTWNPGEARRALRTVLEKTSRHECVVEIIMKDVSTLRYAPQRLWEWAEIAREETSRWA
ncbi:MAG: hypothetical protein PHW60_04380 [Kiritimatiellae bacterium]|nr:hypothetical protein [Kiritimatiellia bacterium]